MLSIEEEGKLTITFILAASFGTSYAMCNESSNNLSIKELLKKKLFKTYRILQRQTFGKTGFID